MAALHVARQAITGAGWTPDELKDAALVVEDQPWKCGGLVRSVAWAQTVQADGCGNTIHSGK